MKLSEYKTPECKIIIKIGDIILTSGLQSVESGDGGNEFEW